MKPILTIITLGLGLTLAACAGGVTGLDYNLPKPMEGPAGAPVIALMPVTGEAGVLNAELFIEQEKLNQELSRVIAGELSGTGLFSKVVAVEPEEKNLAAFLKAQGANLVLSPTLREFDYRERDASRAVDVGVGVRLGNVNIGVGTGERVDISCAMAFAFRLENSGGRALMVKTYEGQGQARASAISSTIPSVQNQVISDALGQILKALKKDLAENIR